jgi:replication initiation protein RepC
METYTQNLPVHSRQAVGWSRITSETLATEAIASRYSVRERQIKKWSLYQAVDNGAAAMGIARNVKDLLLLLIKYTRDNDYIGQNVPVAWPSNAELADKLDVGERQVINIINSAIKMGFLLRLEGNSPRRNGARNAKTGEIVFARGFDLRPLVVRYDDFIEARASQKRLAKDRRHALRALDIAWRRLLQLSDHLMELAPHSSLFETLAEQSRKHSQVRDRKDLDDILILTQSHQNFANLFEEEIRANVKNNMENKPDNNASTTTNPAQNFTRITNTNHSNKFLKRNTCNDRLPKPSSDLQEGSSRLFESANDSIPEGFLDDCSNLTITPTMLLEASPPLEAIIDLREDLTWSLLYRAILGLKRDLGINSAVFTDAIRIMGPVNTMLAIAIAAARRDEIENVGGWLRGCCDASLDGKFSPIKSIYGLLQRYGKHQSRSAGKWAERQSEAIDVQSELHHSVRSLLALVPSQYDRVELWKFFKQAPIAKIAECSETLKITGLTLVQKLVLELCHDDILKRLCQILHVDDYEVTYTDAHASSSETMHSNNELNRRLLTALIQNLGSTVAQSIFKDVTFSLSDNILVIKSRSAFLRDFIAQNYLQQMKHLQVIAEAMSFDIIVKA